MHLEDGFKPKHVGAILCTPKQIYSAYVGENKKDFYKPTLIGTLTLCLGSDGCPRPRIIRGQVQSQVKTYDIFDTQIGTGTNFSPSTLVSPVSIIPWLPNSYITSNRQS